jgi:hypothetical protein
MTQPTAKASQGTNQHFVSRLLLRPFETDTFRGRAVWVLDKQTMEIRGRAISSTASEQGFYDAEGMSLDGFITKFESDLGDVLTRVRRSSSLADLDDKSQRIVSLGMATQLLRTKRMRTRLEQCAAGTLGDARGGYVAETAQWFAEDYENLSPRDVQLDWLSELAFDLARFFFTKTWVVVKPIGGIEFITSDNPVIIRTPVGCDPSHVLELGTLYLPIAPQLAIAFLPRDVTMSGDKSFRLAGLRMHIPNVHASVDQTEAHLMNALQLENADRLVISHRKDLLVSYQKSIPEVGS